MDLGRSQLGTEIAAKQPTRALAIRHGLQRGSKRSSLVWRVYDSQFKVSSDTWVWDGTSWTQRSAQTSPPLRGPERLEVSRRVLGEEHPNTLRLMESLVRLYDNQDKYAQAEALLSKVLDVSRRVLGEEHPSTLTQVSRPD